MKTKNKIYFISIITLFGLFLFSKSAFAATYYVSTSGDDVNSGTTGSPFRTIQKCADTANAGDTCHISAGTYYERINIPTSGVIFEGERSGNNWLSIIDGSDATSGWVPAPEKDPYNQGVYKNTSIPYEPYAMTADGDKNVVHLSQRVMANDPLMYEINRNNNGFDILAKPKDSLYDYKNNSGSMSFTNSNFQGVKFYDGVEAYFGYIDGTTYLRFKDGSNPNSRNVRVSPGGGCESYCGWPKGSAVTVDTKNNLIIKNLLIRGAEFGIKIKNSYNVTIDNNRIVNGHGRIYVYGSGAHDISISNNDLEINQLGFENYTPGAKTLAVWDPSAYPDPYGITVSFHYYQIFKNLAGDTTETNADSGINLLDTGENIRIFNNKIHDGGATGITLDHNSEFPNSAYIYNNQIYNIAAEGIMLYRMGNAQIYDNLMYNNSFHMRIHDLEAGNRKIYVYRNKFYNPSMLGQGIHLYVDENDPFTYSGFPEVWFYHNSLSGGAAAIGYGSNNLLNHFYFFNNIFSSYTFYLEPSNTLLYNPSALGSFDYNWVGTTVSWQVGPWFTVPNNIKSNSQLWAGAGMPDFSLPPGSSAIGAGIDLSGSYSEIGGLTSVLPGMAQGYFPGLKPDLGAVQSGIVSSDTTPPSAPVNVIVQ